MVILPPLNDEWFTLNISCKCKLHQENTYFNGDMNVFHKSIADLQINHLLLKGHRNIFHCKNRCTKGWSSVVIQTMIDDIYILLWTVINHNNICEFLALYPGEAENMTVCTVVPWNSWQITNRMLTLIPKFEIMILLHMISIALQEEDLFHLEFHLDYQYSLPLHPDLQRLDWPADQ